MKEMSSEKKILVQLALAVLSIAFLFPFIWLVLTSLKPLEQTMIVPPQWVPRAYYIDFNGKPLDVKKERKVAYNGYIVNIQMDKVDFAIEKTRLYIRKSELIDGKYIKVRHQIADIVKWVNVPVEIEKVVKKDWWLVEERVEQRKLEGRTAKWDIVSESEITSKVKFYWDNYIKVTDRMPIWTYTKNTLIVCVLGVIGAMLSNAFVAYGFSRIKWRGRDTFFIITLASMMIPFPVTMIPMYSVFKSIGWVGHLYPLWVPPFFANAFNIFLLRQFFMTIPYSLTDSARIDGCNEFQIFYKIILPLTKPALAVVGLFHFMGAWNDFMTPLIYLTEKETFTLSLGLQFLQSQHGGTDWNILMAASTLVLLPILILFFFTQKTFVQGITLTGIKE